MGLNNTYTINDIIKDDNHRFPMTSSNIRVGNKKVNYKVLALMTLFSNKQTLENFYETGSEDLYRYLYKNKLFKYRNLVENLTNMKLETIIKVINNMTKIDTGIRKITTEGGEIVYYMDYKTNDREFVIIHAKILKQLITYSNSNCIKVYIILNYMCRKGKVKITNSWLLKQIGLKPNIGNNNKQIADITKTLCDLGLINKYTEDIDGKSHNWYSINSYEEWKLFNKLDSCS